MAEWLRRWTANPLGSARAGSNPVIIAFFCSVSVDGYHVCFTRKRSLVRVQYRTTYYFYSAIQSIVFLISGTNLTFNIDSLFNTPSLFLVINVYELPTGIIINPPLFN